MEYIIFSKEDEKENFICPIFPSQFVNLSPKEQKLPKELFQGEKEKKKTNWRSENIGENEMRKWESEWVNA